LIYRYWKVLEQYCLSLGREQCLLAHS